MDKKKRKTFCIVCASKIFNTVETFKKPRKYNIIECLSCGVMMQEPMPTVSFLKNEYKKIYSSKKKDSSTEKAFYEFDRRQEKGRIKEIQKFKKGGSLLDVGASSGFFIKVLSQDKRWNAIGLEYSLPAVKEARKNEIDLIHGDIFSSHLSSKINSGQFDVITMHSVLEHVPDPNSCLKEIHNNLKKTGLLVFSVPNIRSFEYFFYKKIGKRFPGFIDEHIYYFTPHSISIILKNQGFTIKKITSRHYSTIHFPSRRPLVGWITFPVKLLLEYTQFGGSFKIGNLLYVYAEKDEKKN